LDVRVREVLPPQRTQVTIANGIANERS